ncbi:hypothetical protein N9L68_06585, partial [bacterium]|nr:hypothetical protein [bacterium]
PVAAPGMPKEERHKLARQIVSATNAWNMDRLRSRIHRRRRRSERRTSQSRDPSRPMMAPRRPSITFMPPRTGRFRP